ncbi:MAG: DUF3298 and DUF4163 domain-containing protein [Paramuribaculum sp.]|nr:DUF3298 and DUF4163 domain-containing protein [Paramuribaculum sp.]
MKKNTLFNAIIASAAGVAIIATGCARASERSNGDNSDGVKSIPFHSELLSISKTYRGFNGSDSCSLTLSAFIDYPTAIGNADIAPLQAAIKEAVFDKQSDKSIEAVMDSFASEVDSYDLNIDPEIAGAPANLDEINAYVTDMTLNRVAVNSKMVTYSLTDMRYLGGAHPMTFTRSFTYAIEQQQVLTLDNMFKPDEMDIVFSAVNQSLASQYGVASGDLQSAGFFQNSVGVPSLFSVINGTIVFHYNPYDVAPYYMGAIDVAVSPVMIEDALTPMAKDLLL